MKGLSGFQSNYTSRNRPRRFFNDTMILIKQRTMLGNGGLSYNPNWREGKVA